MLTISDTALARLHELATEVCAPDEALRLALDDRGEIDFDVGTPRMADQVIEHNGRQVLLVDNSTAGILEEATLDVDTSGAEPKFVIQR
ncbi:MAG: hypothetical protein HY329_21125 [Chloroflexi bacterium]|nr:hypothetical protein [Chloroflexota bacterium]